MKLTSKNSKALRMPDIGAEESDILDYRDKKFNYLSVKRSRDMERMAMANLYHINRQWIELDTDVLVNGTNGYSFRDTPLPEGLRLPRPVTNYITASVEVELTSLGKRQLTANVVTNSSDPRIEAAARKAKEILEQRLKDNNWPDLREDVTFLTILCGTGILKSYWDETWLGASYKSTESAVQCVECGYAFSAPTMPVEAPEEVIAEEPAGDMPTEAPGVPSEAPMEACPHCGGQIVPGELDEATAAGADMFGRPLGQLAPKGRTVIEVVSPFDLFPENTGIDVDPRSCKVWAQATVRTMDWVEERYPEIIDEVEPEDPQELMRYHPTMGEWAILGRYSSAYDSDVYDNHVRVYEIHAERSYRFPEGHSLVICGDKVAFDGPLYVTVETEQGPFSVPRVKYSAARWKTRHKEFWGQSLVDDLISPQNRLNGMDAQITEARERLGSPNVIASESMEFQGPEHITEYGLGKIMRYQIDPLNPNAKPEVLGGTLMPSEVYQERDRIIQDMREIAGPQAIELGEAPKNITTTSGLQLLAEKSDSRRSPRERVLISMYETIWEHQLKLVWALQTEPEEYEIQTAEGSWERKQYDRRAVEGQVKIRIEKQSYVDKSLYQKEAAREAQIDGLYVVDSQLAKKRLLELRGLPTDVNPDLNRQVDVGKKQWVDFVDNMIVPVPDPTLDDPLIRHQVLGTYLLQEEGQLLMEEVGWRETVKLIGGWEQELMQLELMDQMALQFYGGRVDPQTGQAMYEQGMVMYEQQLAEFDQVQSAGAQAAADGMAPPPVQPPQPPPPPIFLPPAKEDRIYALWMQMIQRQQPMQQAPPIGSEDEIAAMAEFEARKDAFLRFRAVVEAYRIYAQERQLQMMGGMPMPAAPGTPGGTPGMGGALPGVAMQGAQATPTPPTPPQVPVK